MSIDYNLSLLGGRLTQDPVSIGNGKGARFSMASNRYYRDSEGERVEETTYMDITVWAGLAELVLRRCRKGSPVLVEGRLESRKVKDDEGNTKKYVNIVANEIRFIDSNIEHDDVDDDEVPVNMDEKSFKAFKKLCQK